MPPLIAVLCIFTAITAPISAMARADSGESAVVTGPISGGKGIPAFLGTSFSLAQYGYEQDEYFFSGTARAYGTPAPPAPYTSRMVVWRPADARKFNGTAIAEWVNVSGQTDVMDTFAEAHAWAFKQGYIYVGIDAQRAGICGPYPPELDNPLPDWPACLPTSAKGFDPIRYSSLHHPGDTYAFDMFSQAVTALRNPHGKPSLTGGLAVKHVIAAGQSQSATELDTYLSNGADAGRRVIDAVLSHSDTGKILRGPFRVPVIQLWTEDSIVPAPTMSEPNHRVWQAVGGAHTSAYAYAYVNATMSHTQAQSELTSTDVLDRTAGGYGQEGVSQSCTSSGGPGGDEYPVRYNVDAALAALQAWITRGMPAPEAPAATFAPVTPVTGDFVVGPTLSLVRDADGNARGGLRLPPLDVPVASYTGPVCALFGVSQTFTPQRLAQLYPSHHAYVTALRTATDAAVRKRFMVCDDAIDLLERAKASSIGGKDIAAQGVPACAGH